MLTTILIGLLTWSLVILLLCWMNHRWCVRMEKMDADLEAAVRSNPNRIIAAGVRPYPE